MVGAIDLIVKVLKMGPELLVSHQGAFQDHTGMPAICPAVGWIAPRGPFQPTKGEVGGILPGPEVVIRSERPVAADGSPVALLGGRAGCLPSNPPWSQSPGSHPALGLFTRYT